MRLKLAIGPDGKVVLPQREAEALGVLDEDPIDLHVVRGSFALVERPRAADQGFLAGSLQALSVPEVFHFLSTSLKTGTLLLSFASPEERATPDTPEGLRRKTISFRDGQVAFASSSERADRLGAVLWRNGLATKGDLDRCSRLVQAGRPLGQVMVDEGLLDSGQLYAAMTLQVREIVLNAFLEEEGEFVFVEGSPDERNAVKLPERTRELLLEGMRRREEVERLSADVPDRDAPVRRTGKAAASLEERDERLLAAADGTRTVRRLLDETQLGLFEGLRSLAGLVRGGLVERMAPRAPKPAAPQEPPAAPAPAAPPASGPFDTYGRIFRFIYEELAMVQPNAARRLDSFFDRLPPGQRSIFKGVRLGADGDLDVAQVLLNVSAEGGRQGAAARARALEALESFLAFALFEVKNCLPRAAAERALKEVGRMQVGRA
ncbi:MAG TPA: DUF4388 domain-containing protein [Anaeromyxobacteraceae bacterium]|nr:DUF4388 domain-containing protein [Anaeromyxobacteraceae bacterium]